MVRVVVAGEAVVTRLGATEASTGNRFLCLFAAAVVGPA